MSEENVQTVKVTSIDVPFGDIFWLTFKAWFASILVGIVLAIPLFLLIVPIVARFA
jgi:hypothetical protein